MPQKNVLVLNYYRSRNAKGAKEIETAINDAGGNAKIMHYTAAQKIIDKGGDLLKDYTSAQASGSDISWKKKGDYLSPGANKVATYLVNHSKPVKFECGSAQAAYHAIGEQSGGNSYKVMKL